MTHLLISRKQKETIVINPGVDEIVIRINEINSNRVRLSVICEKHNKIIRGELRTREGS